MRRMILYALTCGALVVVAGCISYEQHITFEEDGSGRIVVDTWIDYFGDGEEGEGAETAAREPELELSEEMGPAFASAEGVNIEENWIKMEGEGEDRVEHSKLVLTFDKVARLTGCGVFKDQDMTFEKKGKKYIYTQTITHEPKEGEEETTAESEELMRSLFEGYTFTYSVVMPGEIVETNGTKGEDGRTVTWEWPLYEFTQQEEIVMTATSKK